MSSAAVPPKKYSGLREKDSGIGRKPFAFTPESFSRSPWNPHLRRKLMKYTRDLDLFLANLSTYTDGNPI
jgi:hypothetical protein